MKFRFHKLLSVIISIVAVFSVFGCGGKDEFDLEKEITRVAKLSAEFFSYYESIDPTAGNFHVGENEIEGQCGDYALKFVLLWNELYPDQPAEMVFVNQHSVTANGSYRVLGERTDFDYSSWWPYEVSGLTMYSWNNENVFGLYHSELGFYQLEVAEEYTVIEHFGVDMTSILQVHAWAKVGDIIVDPCYADVFDTPFIGTDIIAEVEEPSDFEKEIIRVAKLSAEFFSYYELIDPTAGNFHVGENEIEGQCGDYALKFVLLWNELHPDQPAEIVLVNQHGITANGSYRVVGERTDMDYASWWPFEISGLASYEFDSKEVFGIYHSGLGFFELEIVEEYTVIEHFGVDMTNELQVHAWAKVGDIIVDPCYADVFNTPFIGTNVIAE